MVESHITINRDLKQQLSKEREKNTAKNETEHRALSYEN